MPVVTTRKLTTVRINDSGTHKLGCFFFWLLFVFSFTSGKMLELKKTKKVSL